MSIQATGRFFTLYDGLAMLDGSDEVFVSWMVLERTSVAVGVFDPSSVLARRLPDCDQDCRIWEAKPTRAPRRRPAVVEEPLALADGNVDDDDEGEVEADESRPEEEGADDMDRFEAQLAALIDESQDFAENGFQAGGHVAGGDGLPEVAGIGMLGPNAAEAAPPPAVPAPLEPPVALAAAAPRGSAEVTYHVPGGTIAYYRSKQAFQAVCDNAAHGRCVLTRTSRGRAAGPDGAQRGGRPIGFLAAWLSAGENCATKAEHWVRLDNGHADRLALRQQIAQTPEGVRLMSFERPLADGEEVEPLDLRGLL